MTSRWATIFDPVCHRDVDWAAVENGEDVTVTLEHLPTGTKHTFGEKVCCWANPWNRARRRFVVMQAKLLLAAQEATE